MLLRSSVKHRDSTCQPFEELRAILGLDWPRHHTPIRAKPSRLSYPRPDDPYPAAPFPTPRPAPLPAVTPSQHDSPLLPLPRSRHPTTDPPVRTTSYLAHPNTTRRPEPASGQPCPTDRPFRALAIRTTPPTTRQLALSPGLSSPRHHDWPSRAMPPPLRNPATPTVHAATSPPLFAPPPKRLTAPTTRGTKLSRSPCSRRPLRR